MALINTGAANIHSVAKAIRSIGGSPEVTTDSDKILSAHAAVLPGVGANDAVMRALNANGLPEAIRSFAESGRPLLCICLGMQILFDRSEEGELPGLGLLGGEVLKLPQQVDSHLGATLKVPHMGWNQITFKDEEAERHPAFANVAQGMYFYFVHSYHCVPSRASDTAATAWHGIEICAAIAHENIVGTQFHPEKSGRSGLSIYDRFLDHATAVS